MTTQHTPGPWRLAWGKIVDQSDKAVCLLTPRKGAMNANIIAAAPDMLDALQRIESSLEHEPEIYADILSVARNAIAKAEQ